MKEFSTIKRELIRWPWTLKTTQTAFNKMAYIISGGESIEYLL